ncbi:MAG TPA: nitrilase-related carbon-nitrogen hydrolase [Bacteroidota bacterium]|nr:nitrilase-related carbon-nitrogen hydrolase [Bacteroidota bacterium]
MNLKVALAQIDSKVGNVDDNLRHHLEVADRAKRRGAKLILFPELSLTGYSLKDLVWDVALQRSDSVLSPLLKKSKDISMAVGFVESGENHAIYNAAMFLEDGVVKHVHRKVYPPTYGMFEEGRYFSAGRGVSAFDSKHGRFGMLICEDLWHVSLPYLLALDGAEGILCLTASPTRLAGETSSLGIAEVNHEQHRAYARLLSLYVVWCNRVGFEDGVNFWGGSTVTSPSGETIAQGKEFNEDLVVAELSSHEVMRARRFSRHFLDEKPDMVVRELRRILRK